MSAMAQPEPWLRGTWTDVPPIHRATLHALELAKEDLDHWCSHLTDEQLNARPCGIAPVAFHIRHIARSTNRLLTYTEGAQLNRDQLSALQSEMAGGATCADLFRELEAALSQAAVRIRALVSVPLDLPRTVGRKELPT